MGKKKLTGKHGGCLANVVRIFINIDLRNIVRGQSGLSQRLI